MSIQDLHSLLIPGKTSTHLIQKPFIFIFRPFLFWHFAVSTKDCNFSNQSCEYFINLLQLKSWVWFKVGAETLNWIVWWRDQSNKTLFKSDVYSVRQNHGAGAREHSCFFPPWRQQWQWADYLFIQSWGHKKIVEWCWGGGALHRDNLGNCSLVTIHHGLSPGRHHRHSIPTLETIGLEVGTVFGY